MEITIEDFFAMTYTVIGEASNETFEGQVAVANVILNRVYQSPDPLATPFEICHAPYQFSLWNNSPDNNLERVMKIRFGSRIFLTAARAVLTALLRISDNTKGSRHYHVRTMQPKPSWAEGKVPIVTIGNHAFYNDVR